MKEITASMAGTVFQVIVSVGESIEEGQVVVVLESMKMEIPVESSVSGVVKEVHIAEGDFVNEEDLLVSIE